MQPGRYWLRSEADPDDVVVESDESNPGAFASTAAVIPGYRAAAVDAGVVPGEAETEITLGAMRFGAAGTRRFRIVDAPEHGTLDVPAGPSFGRPDVTYTPDPGHDGPDSFTYAAFDADSPVPAHAVDRDGLAERRTPRADRGDRRRARPDGRRQQRAAPGHPRLRRLHPATGGRTASRAAAPRPA